MIATPEMMTSAATDLTAFGSKVSAPTLAEIAELAPLAEDSPVDQILARRAERARRGEAVVGSHAAGPGAKSNTANGCVECIKDFSPFLLAEKCKANAQAVL